MGRLQSVLSEDVLYTPAAQPVDSSEDYPELESVLKKPENNAVQSRPQSPPVPECSDENQKSEPAPEGPVCASEAEVSEECSPEHPEHEPMQSRISSQRVLYCPAAEPIDCSEDYPELEPVLKKPEGEEAAVCEKPQECSEEYPDLPPELAPTLQDKVLTQKTLYCPADECLPDYMEHEPVQPQQQVKGKYDLQALITNIVLSEAWNSGQDRKIARIYYNVYNAHKQDYLEAFKTSRAYYNPNTEKPSDWFRIWSCMLGDGQYCDEPPPAADGAKDFKTIKAFVDENEFMQNKERPRMESALDIVKEMFANPPDDKYNGWFGQGSIVDFNSASSSFVEARAYISRQEADPKLEKLVEILPGDTPGHRSVIFHTVKIHKYWQQRKDKPDHLPEVVPKYP